MSKNDIFFIKWIIATMDPILIVLLKTYLKCKGRWSRPS